MAHPHECDSHPGQAEAECPLRVVAEGTLMQTSRPPEHHSQRACCPQSRVSGGPCGLRPLLLDGGAGPASEADMS